MNAEKERQRIVNEARRIKAEIEQIFIDVAHWNEHVRTPFEEPIDPDPDGLLGHNLAAINKTLTNENRPRKLG